MVMICQVRAGGDSKSVFFVVDAPAATARRKLESRKTKNRERVKWLDMMESGN